MRTRLVAIIVIPTVAAVALGGMRIAENVQTTLTHDHIEEMGSLGRSVVTLGNELGRERLLTAAYIADDPAPDQRDEELLTQLQEQYKETQQARQTVLNGANELSGNHQSQLMANRMESMLEDLEELDSIRDEVTETRITVLPAVTQYRQVMNSLIGFNETIAQSTENTDLRESVRALTALSGSREQLSYEGSLMLHALTRGGMSGGVREAIENSRARYENEVQNFADHATVGQRQEYNDSFTSREVSQMSTVRLRVMLRADNDQSLSGFSEDGVLADYREHTEGALDTVEDVETRLAGSVQDTAAELRTNALTSAIIETLAVLLVVVTVFGVTVAMARSLVRPLRQLRTGALRVAKQDLPDSISRVQEMSIAPEDVDITPIEVTARDEIGEVARSFDEVHRVALRLASEEAALRSNVNAMFVNLSRRSQTLVERQIRLIDGLEQTEQDDERLADLFRLDHLATRMRRNNENLLVLSGQDNTRKWAQPVPLVDVLRGAVSEVEQYDRVNVRAPSHISVLGRPVNDVIHLVAEVVENATAFSPHESQVGVTAESLDDGGVRVDITDNGIGMAPDELEMVNQRLAEPPVIDVAVSRRMGLFVVSRLAARHGIDVQLHDAHNGGVTARVVLPSDLLITPVEPTTSGMDGGSAVPDTFAEATAAFAANPAPAEPPDGLPSGQTHAGSQSGAPRSDLPKRNPGEHKVWEHPPSGQDLWSTAGSDASDGRSRPAESSPAEPEQPASPWPTGTQESPPGYGSTSPATPAWPEAGQAPWSRAGAQEQESAFGQNEPGSEGSLWRTDPSGEPPESTWRSEHPAAGPAADAESPERPSAPPNTHEAGPERREGYGSTAYLSRRYGTTGAGQHTVVPPTPESSSEALPIFDAIESNWFKRRTGGPGAGESETGSMPYVNGGANTSATPEGRYGPEVGAQSHPPRSEPASAPSQPHAEDDWRSQADPGWQAARTAAEPSAGGLTNSGLPKRVPKANLVPGAAPQPETPKQTPERSADRIRNRFSGFQQGLRQGRGQTGDQRPEER
ncbi:sensor histidine kinase [Halostreptopolyspora alba]|uniref:sensor histidine kinase n=1 Tax=Halostreptopolyspora alba TaxID=2487137 RepID=UPI00371ACBA3